MSPEHPMVLALETAAKLLRERKGQRDELARRFYGPLYPMDYQPTPDEDKLRELESEEAHIQAQGQSYESLGQELERVVKAFRTEYELRGGRPFHLIICIHPSICNPFRDPPTDPNT